MKLKTIAVTVLALALTSFAVTTNTQQKPSPSTPAVATYTSPDGVFTVNAPGKFTVDAPKDRQINSDLTVKVTIYHTATDVARYGVIDNVLPHTATEDEMALIGADFIKQTGGSVIDGQDLSDNTVIMVLKVPTEKGNYGAYLLVGFYGNHVIEAIFTAPLNTSTKETIDGGLDFVRSLKVNPTKTGGK